MKKDFNSRTKTQTYVTYLFPGILFAETESAKVKDRDLKGLKVPKGAYGFYFYDVTTTKVNGETLTGDEKKRSKMHLFAERVLTLKDVKREFPGSESLQDNMTSNGYANVVRTIQGNFQPVDKDTIVLNKKREVIFPLPKNKANQVPKRAR